VRVGRVAAPPRAHEVRIDLSGGTSIEGTVAGVRGDTVHTVTYSRLGPAARLIAWVRVLVLTAGDPDRGFEACTIGRGRTGRATVSVARIGPLDGDPEQRRATALRHLDEIADLYRRGMCAPLPLYARTSAAWAEAAAAGKDPAAAAARAWESEFNRDKEDKEPEHRLVLGERISFEVMCDSSGAASAEEASWVPAPWPSSWRFAAYAHRAWDAALAHEEVVDR
jgi:exodeoxyribonuclease V gamma subunit